jgi:hypothetical protein
MATIYEELLALVDKLSEEKAEVLVARLREEETTQVDDQEWFREVRELHERLKAKYGSFGSVADLINELREERLDDLMGSG